jgi:hypothetical protein
MQRIILAAPVTERVVLDAAADLVHPAVADRHDMERIGDAGGVIEVRRQPSAIRLGEIGRHQADPGEPARIGVGASATQVRCRVALHEIDHPRLVEIHEPGHVRRCLPRLGGLEAGLINTELAHGLLTAPTRGVSDGLCKGFGSVP